MTLAGIKLGHAVNGVLAKRLEMTGALLLMAVAVSFLIK
jgi:putative Mn2+ efflux pump MntP